VRLHHVAISGSRSSLQRPPPSGIIPAARIPPALGAGSTRKALSSTKPARPRAEYFGDKILRSGGRRHPFCAIYISSQRPGPPPTLPNRIDLRPFKASTCRCHRRQSPASTCPFPRRSSTHQKTLPAIRPWFSIGRMFHNIPFLTFILQMKREVRTKPKASRCACAFGPSCELKLICWDQMTRRLRSLPSGRLTSEISATVQIKQFAPAFHPADCRHPR